MLDSSDIGENVTSLVRRVAVYGSYPDHAVRSFVRCSQGLRNSCWPDVAWRFSTLMQGGGPVELVFSSSDNALRYTIEAAGPEADQHSRLDAVGSLMSQLRYAPPAPSLMESWRNLQAESSLVWGAWLGVRHDDAGESVKIYIEIPPGSRFPGASHPSFEPLPGSILHMAGYEPSRERTELYFSKSGVDPSELRALTRVVGSEHQRDTLLAHFADLCGMPLEAALRWITLGYSVAYGKGNETPQIALFVRAKAIVGGAASVRRKLLELQSRSGLRSSAYLELLGPIADHDLPDHGIITLALRTTGQIELRVGINLVTLAELAFRSSRPASSGMLSPAQPGFVEHPGTVQLGPLLKSSHEPACSSDKMNAPCSVRQSIRFLLDRQDPDGAWRDFQLPPGRSDAWVTAYVGAILAAAPWSDETLEVSEGVKAAAGFLDRSRCRTGGWGYNDHCPVDADSTARGILFFRETGSDARSLDYAALSKFQLSDGSFTTYRTGDAKNGWNAAHPDVTVAALRALRRVLSIDHAIVRRGLSYLEQYLRSSHALDSYWWVSPNYLAKELFQLYRELPMGFLNLPRFAGLGDLLAKCTDSPSDSFALALALEAEVLSGRSIGRISALARRLERQQSDDGGWPSAPNMRFTDHRARQIGDLHFRSSPVVSDDRRLFTTATALSALNAAAQNVRLGTARAGGFGLSAQVSHSHDC